MNGPISSAVLPLLRCPRCAGVLEGDSTLGCSACGVRYPLVDGMPWLLPAPDLALAEWRGRLHAMTTHLKRQAALYRAALRPDVTRPTTRNRLKLLAMACSDHARRLQALLAPLEAEPAAAATYAALAPVVAAAQGLASYYPNVHRDWVWGEEENQAALAAVRRALGSVRPERLLVLGCGAGRLPYDLHAILRPAATVAVDINPLLMAVARRMYAAERVDLYEFPIAPRDLASHALLRTLTAPAPAEPGLHLVFGDAKQPPFAPGSFDTVVTPWLVDVVDTELESLAAIVNSLLAPGGHWVCTGTLFFQQADPERAYSTEEVQEIVAGAGFESPRLQSSRQPYLASPASRHARVEEVVTFAVCKQHEAELPLRPMPSWLADPRHPVPLLPEVADHALALRVRSYVASLVDGRRSMSDIAAKLVAERLLPPAEATGIVRDYLLRLHDEAQLRTGT
ncbi:MAG: methyltransferase domain-containing protein [Gammaproteobacteria bacterium]|nr:methyltransferase domain-containing protein [Gammaproteobacteria bacterium]MDH4310645.1 methyltransferase domain-containing protein [Gammaproteobacteria bacterium]